MSILSPGGGVPDSTDVAAPQPSTILTPEAVAASTQAPSLEAAAPTNTPPPALDTALGTPTPAAPPAAPSLTLNQQDLARRAASLVKLYPTLRNEGAVVASLISMPVSDDDLFANVGQTMTAAQAKVQVSVLANMEASDSRAAYARWQAFSPQMQQAIVNNGGTAPRPPAPGRMGFWDHLGHIAEDVTGGGTKPFLGTAGDLLGAVGSAVHTVANDVVAPVGRVTHTSAALNFAGRVPGDLMGLPGHIYRAGTAHLPGDVGSIPYTGGSAFSAQNVFSAWEQTAPGKPFYTESAMRAAQAASGGNADLLRLAMLTGSSGGDPIAAVQKMMGPPPNGVPTPAYSARATQLLALTQGNPQLDATLRALHLGGVSIGRDIARQSGLKEGTGTYGAVSGAGDALFDWYANPLVAAGKVTSVMRASRAVAPAEIGRAIAEARLPDRLSNLSAGSTTDAGYFARLAALPVTARQRWAIAAADHANDGNAVGWLAARPAQGAGVQALINHAATVFKPAAIEAGTSQTMHANDVLEWLDTTVAGRNALAQRQFTNYLTPNAVELPQLSKAGAVKTWAKVNTVPLGHLAANPAVDLNAGDLIPTQSWLARTGSLLGNMPYKLHELATAPIHSGQVALTGDASLPSFVSYVRQYLLPSAQRDQLVNAFAQAPGAAARRELVAQATEAGMRQFGFDSTEAGQQAMDSYVTHMRQAYEPTGRDLLPDGRGPATLDPELEDTMAVHAPGLREIFKVASETNALGVTRRAMTNPLFESMMHRYWSPLALARVGFIPRVVSEEWLTALMRLQPSQVAEGYAATMIPRLKDRVDAWGGDPTANPVTRFTQQLMAHGLGLGDQMVYARDPALHRAGFDLNEANQAVKGQKYAAANLVALAKARAKTADLTSIDSPQTAAAAEAEKVGAAALHRAMERVGRSPLVRKAYGHLFATGGGYMPSVNVSGVSDLRMIDSGYEPVTTLEMAGTYRRFANGTMGSAPDPAFTTAAADYLSKFGRTGTNRAGLAAVMGFAPSDRQLGELRQVFAGTGLVGRGASDDEMLTRLRSGYTSAPDDVQAMLRLHAQAVKVGDGGTMTNSGKALYDRAGGEDIGPDTRKLLTGVIGKGNYRPILKGDVTEADALDKTEAALIKSYRNARTQPRRTALAVQIQAGRDAKGVDASALVGRAVPDHPPLSAEGLESLFVSPDAPIVRGKAAAEEVAYRAMLTHMHSPEFARHIPHSDHIQDGLAEPVTAAQTRLYYPAATPDWTPGDPNLEKVVEDNPRLAADMAATVLNRRSLSDMVNAANEQPTHQAIGAWAHTNPERAQQIAGHLAGEKAAVGYYDIPNELLAAQDLSHPTAELQPGNPWASHAKATAAMTEQIRKRMAVTLGDGNVKGWRLTEAQQAAGSVLRDDHTVLPDGTWANGHTLEDNLQQLARKKAGALVDALAPNGRMLHGVGARLLSQDAKTLSFTVNDLKGIAPGELPRAVVGPVEAHSLVDSGGNAFGKGGRIFDPVFTRFTRMFFDKGVSPAIDSLVRQPAFVVNFAKAMHAAEAVEPIITDAPLRAFGEAVAKQLRVTPADLRQALDLRQEVEAKGGTLAADSPEAQLLERAAAVKVAAPANHADPLADYATMENHIDDHLGAISIQRGIADTLPYVNNHQMRSNLTEWNRNTAPFAWAQESFLKRWSRATAYNPATFARLELGIHGLASMGVVHKDAYGQDAITIPGSGALNQVLADIGIKDFTMPKQIPFTMELKNMTPGFAHPTLPAVGPVPLLTIQLGSLFSGQPELNKIDQTLSVNRPAGLTGVVDQLFPATWARNVWKAATSNPNSQDFASAKLQTMQMMAAAGLTPTDRSDAATLQTFQNRLNTWTRNTMVLRGVLGFFAPGSMAFDNSGNTVAGTTVDVIHKDLSADIAMLGVSGGISEFMRQHPDAGPYTVFPNTSTGSLSPPATTAAEQSLTANADFFQTHPYAGAYFLPAAPGNFDRKAYLTEIADGIRVRKGWDTLATEIAVAAASNAYYPMHQQYLDALNATVGNSAAQTQIKAVWKTLDANFLAAHPLFAQQLTATTGHNTRMKVLDDVRGALLAGNTPSAPAATALGGMLTMYDQWKEAHQMLAAQNTGGATERRKAVDAMFAQLVSSYLSAHPLAADFYQRIIVPEVAVTDSTLGHTLEASAP